MSGKPDESEPAMNQRKSQRGIVHAIFRRQLPLESETCLFILVNAFDYFLTYWGLWHGILRETNQVARWFLDGWGLIKGLLLYKFTLVLLVCGIAQIVATQRPETARWLLIGSSIAITGVVIYSARLLVIHGGIVPADDFVLARLYFRQ